MKVALLICISSLILTLFLLMYYWNSNNYVMACLQSFFTGLLIPSIINLINYLGDEE